MNNYLAKLLATASSRVPAGKKPTAVVAQVAHDKWCKLLKGTGDCNCNPEITYRDLAP